MRDWLRKTPGTLITGKVAAIFILACVQQEATAENHGIGSAPKVTSTRTSYEEGAWHGSQNDPAPPITQQRRTTQPSRNPVPKYAQHPKAHRSVNRSAANRPATNRRPPSNPHMDPRVEPARYRSNYYRNREAEIFYDDPGYGEELPAPGGSGDIVYDDPYMEGPGGYEEGPWHEGPWHEEPYFDGGYGGCDSCGGGCGYGRPFCRFFNWVMGPDCDWCWSENLTAFAGVDAFTSPVDYDNKGNFGFDYGLDWGGPLWNSFGLGYQIGGRVVNSNLSGYDQTNTLGYFEDDPRNQYFITVGLFRRFRHCTGFQWGAVYDYLQDDYYDDVSLHQVRAEISYRGPKQLEFGFWAAINAGDDDALSIFGQETVTSFTSWETTDQYNLFLRWTSCSGNEFRVWGGATGDSDGIVGADFRLPFDDRFAIAGVANYLIPGDGAGPVGAQEEAWGIGMNLIWYPGRTAVCASHSKWRPLFQVANNATMVPRLKGSD